MKKIYNSRQNIKRLKDDGWVQSWIKGIDHQFKHPKKKRLTIV